MDLLVVILLIVFIIPWLIFKIKNKAKNPFKNHMYWVAVIIISLFIIVPFILIGLLMGNAAQSIPESIHLN